MTIEQTFSIVKPDAVEKNVIGDIYSRFEKGGLNIVASKMLQLTRERAEGFYAVHKERPFFSSLVKYMISGPIVLFVMEGEGAIAQWRTLMGATDPAQADAGTIRKDFATDIEQNTVHGSDDPETVQTEVAYFFDGDQIFAR